MNLTYPIAVVRPVENDSPAFLAVDVEGQSPVSGSSRVDLVPAFAFQSEPEDLCAVFQRRRRFCRRKLVNDSLSLSHVLNRSINVEYLLTKVCQVDFDFGYFESGRSGVCWINLEEPSTHRRLQNVHMHLYICVSVTVVGLFSIKRDSTRRSKT